MTLPEEFTSAGIEKAVAQQGPSYEAFHTSGEPYRSLITHNPWMRPPKPGQPLEWDAGWYYDTTIARLHPDWRDVKLPQPSRSFAQLQADFVNWGYCLIEDGLSARQSQLIRTRIEKQAAAERALGIAHVSPAQQHVWALVNKGDVFVQCMEHDPQAIQCGPFLEPLLDRLLGVGWHHLSFISNVSFPGCHPQGLHQDQSLIAPYCTTHAPVLVNTIYILQDVDHVNGGTLLIPGSHQANGSNGEQFGKLPRPVNLEAPAGTVVLTDGRLLHGGAVNRSESLRYIVTNSVVRPWIRQQECFHLTIRPEILATASDKFLHRCGFQATAARSMVEGYGYHGSGRQGDSRGAIAHARRRMDAGEYHWVGELDPDNLEDMESSRFSLAAIQREHEPQRFGDDFVQLVQSVDR